MTYKFAILLLLLGFIACKEAPERPTQILEDGYQPTEAIPSISNTDGLNAPATPPAEPPQNAQGVWHYTCPNGCAGGGGGATPCGSCGTTLAHNQAYHAGGATTPGATTPVAGQAGSITSPIVNGAGRPPAGAMATPQIGAPGATAAPTTPEPPQNANGVWHYTCPNGCAGGGGSATACAGCGTTLAHNQAYHQ